MTHARAIFLYTALVSAGSALAADVRGWRFDGSGQQPDAHAPAAWNTVWRTTLAGWSNATPVMLGDQVCTMSEPSSLVCVRASDGTVTWKAEHPVVTALKGREATEAQALLKTVDGMEAEHAALIKAVSALKRDVRRRPEAEDAKLALAQVEARMGLVRELLDRSRWLRTPVDDDMMGYTTPTPVTDGAHIWVLVANGVLACHKADGTLLWSRWLGPRPQEGLRGYSRGHAASPVILGDTLVVPWGNLMGLDPTTGKTRWTDDKPWRDFGTPGTTTVGGVQLVFTPQGRMLRATDGKELASNLGDLYYIGPYAVGDRVYYVGGPPSDATSRKGSIPQHGWSLKGDGKGGVTATKLWTTTLELQEVFYTSPVVHEGALYSADKSGTLRIFDVDTGEVRHTVDLLPALGGWTYPSPSVVGGEVWIGSGKGHFVSVDDEGGIVRQANVEAQMRSTPLFVGDAVYVRTMDALVRFGP